MGRRELKRTDARLGSIASAYVKPEHIAKAHLHFAGALRATHTDEEMNQLTDDDLHDAFKAYAAAVPEHAVPEPALSTRDLQKKTGHRW